MEKWFKLLVGSVLVNSMLSAQTLKVVTINVWSGLDYVGNLKMGEYETPEVREARYQVLIAGLKELNPDVLALNEANKLPVYAHRIATDLGMDEIHHVGVGGVRAGPIGLPFNLREGDVLLAKPEFQLTFEGRLQLSGGPVGNFFTFHTTDATQVLAGSILVNGVKVYLFATHWHASPFLSPENLMLWRSDSVNGVVTPERYQANIREAEAGQIWREAESRKMLDFVLEISGDLPIITMGDFNAMRGMPEIERYIQAGFKDVFSEMNSTEGFTWDDVLNTNIITYQLPPNLSTERRRRQRIDFILANSAWEILDSKVVLDRPIDGIMPSDHFGVSAKLRLGSGGPPRN